MPYCIKGFFEDGSSKIFRYCNNYDAAVAYLCALSDQRHNYASLIPLLKNIQLISGDHVEFDMQVERRKFEGFHRAALTDRSFAENSSMLSSETVGSDYFGNVRDGYSANIVLMSSYRRPFNELDMLTRWDPSQPNDAGFHSGLDNSRCTVRVMGSGIWREQHADLYFAQQKKIIDQARRRFGNLKIMFDVRNWVVEDPDSALQFQGVNEELYHPDDRLVAIVRSIADKEPPRTALRGNNTEVFTSLNDAERWLQFG